MEGEGPVELGPIGGQLDGQAGAGFKGGVDEEDGFVPGGGAGGEIDPGGVDEVGGLGWAVQLVEEAVEPSLSGPVEERVGQGQGGGQYQSAAAGGILVEVGADAEAVEVAVEDFGLGLAGGGQVEGGQGPIVVDEVEAGSLGDVGGLGVQGLLDGEGVVGVAAPGDVVQADQLGQAALFDDVGGSGVE